jgi:hypothetical protein
MILTCFPYRTESFLLGPKEKKVEEKPDTRESTCPLPLARESN